MLRMSVDERNYRSTCCSRNFPIEATDDENVREIGHGRTKEPTQDRSEVASEYVSQFCPNVIISWKNVE
jgi:hypothetical protein